MALILIILSYLLHTSSGLEIEAHEVFNLKPVYNILEPNDVTVIITVYMRPRRLLLLLNSYCKQKANVSKIIVLISGTPHNRIFQRMVERYGEKDKRVTYIVTPENFGYFGRFQIALQLQSKYVAFSDDDLSPGVHFLEAFVHGINTLDLHGVLGCRGVQYKCSRQFKSCGQRPSTHRTPPSGHPVDALFSFWFMEVQWVKVIFWREPYTWKTAEDMHVTFRIHQFLGLNSYIISSSHVNYTGMQELRIMEEDRSWIDDNQAIDSRVVLRGAIDASVRDRRYNALRDAVLAKIFDAGGVPWGQRLPIVQNAYLLLHCPTISKYNFSVFFVLHATNCTHSMPIFYAPDVAAEMNVHLLPRGKMNNVLEVTHIVALAHNRFKFQNLVIGVDIPIEYQYAVQALAVVYDFAIKVFAHPSSPASPRIWV